MDQNKTDDEFDHPDIDAPTVGRFAAAKNIIIKCESCGQESGWVVYNTNEMPASLVGTRRQQMVLSAPVIQTVPMHCNNCGYVRLYDREFIVRWLKEQKDA